MHNPLRRYDLWDKLEYYGSLPIRELAELLQIAPQLIYYRIRNHQLKKQTCSECGREGLIDIESAREVFPALDKIKAEAEEAETARRDLAT